MKLRAIVAMAAALMVLAAGSAAFAQSDCKKLVPASPWGPNDQTGATNRITPAVTKAGAAEIQEGKVIALSYPLTDGVPLLKMKDHLEERTKEMGKPAAPASGSAPSGGNQ